MLKREDFMTIKTQAEQGVYQKDIAAALGVHPKTISRALKRGAAPSLTRARRGSKLDPFKPLVDRLLSEGVWNSVVILRELQAHGYTGGGSTLRAYITPKRPLQPSRRATVRFETAPGHQLQSDWGEIITTIAGASTKVRFIVNQLAFSRRFHAWCTDSLDAEHTYEGLIRSFTHFGGVPREVLVDNQKTAVLNHPSAGGPQFNPRFLDLGVHYGFTPKACKPARPQTKGKDERMVGYLKQHFFVRYRTFESWAHLNQQLEDWLTQEADQRHHGTVHEVVAERFAREAPHLQPLPPVPYDTSYYEVRKVDWDAYINVRGNRYSVPSPLVNQVVVVRIGLAGAIRVFHQDALVATHQQQDRAVGWSTIEAHLAPLWDATLNVEQRSLQTYEEVIHGT